ncbi:MAG: fused MFS/spermidine synthase [Phycisphaerales bacterium]
MSRTSKRPNVGGKRDAKPEAAIWPRTGVRGWLLYVVFFLSGVAGLGYQMVWTRMFAVGLGHEAPGMLAVVAAFFGGLALGAFVIDPRIGRSDRPDRWYIGLEVMIGAWGLLTATLIPAINELVPTLTGPDPDAWRHWMVAFLVPLATLLPATTAMGATLPAMDRLFCRLVGRPRSIGGLYAANTLGAVAGTLGSAFFIIPALGFSRTVVLLAAMNFVSAALVVVTRRPTTDPRATPAHEPVTDAPSFGRLGVTLFATGLLGIGYEVIAFRVMAQVLENTVYSFATGLSAYLVGTALGAAAYQAFLARRPFRPVLTILIAGLSLACLAGILIMANSESIYNGLRAAHGADAAGSIRAELGLALRVMAPPTLFMGALFSHLVQAARREHWGVGIATGVNTIGGALAPALFGVVLLPMIGSRNTLLVIALAYLLLLCERRLRSLIALLAPVALVFAVLQADLILVQPLPGGRIETHREGVQGTVAVVTDEAGEKYLKVNNKFTMGATISTFAERRLGHLPLLLHPQPKRALYLGLGTGATFAAAGRHPGVTAVGVELNPEVAALLPTFVGDAIDADDDLDVVVADARRYVLASDESFDVIVADLFHPARDGAGSLYTYEHFAAIRTRLADDGLFCQWLPMHQMDASMLATIVRTFMLVYPDADAWIAHFNTRTPMLGLVGRNGSTPAIDQERLAQRLTSVDLRADLSDILIRNPIELLGTFVADAPTLREFAGEGPINTDDNPVVIFEAPAYIYAGSPGTADNVRLIAGLSVSPSAAALGVDDAMAARIAAYRRSRNLFLTAMLAVEQERFEPAADDLLGAVIESKEFPTAYVMALEVARRMAVRDRAGAILFLRDLERADPTRPDAAALRRQIEAAR